MPSTNIHGNEVYTTEELEHWFCLWDIAEEHDWPRDRVSYGRGELELTYRLDEHEQPYIYHSDAETLVEHLSPRMEATAVAQEEAREWREANPERVAEIETLRQERISGLVQAIDAYLGEE